MKPLCKILIAMLLVLTGYSSLAAPSGVAVFPYVFSLPWTSRTFWLYDNQDAIYFEPHIELSNPVLTIRCSFEFKSDRVINSIDAGSNDGLTAISYEPASLKTIVKTYRVKLYNRFSYGHGISDAHAHITIYPAAYLQPGRPSAKNEFRVVCTGHDK